MQKPLKPGAAKELDVLGHDIEHGEIPVSWEDGDTGLGVEHCKGSLELLRCYPFSLLALPVILLCSIIALCVFGLTFAIHNRIDTLEKIAQYAAQDTADALVLLVNVNSGAALTLAAFVKIDPNWGHLSADFPIVAKKVYKQATWSNNYPLVELQYLPFGKISAVYSKTAPRNVSTDLFAPKHLQTSEMYEALERGSLTVAGPLPLNSGGSMALTARFPVFIDNVTKDENWDNPNNQTFPTGCENELCYNSTTGTKFWGFTAVVFYATCIVSGKDKHLQNLANNGFLYRLSKVQDEGGNVNGSIIIVQSEHFDEDKVIACAIAAVPGTDWKLSVYNSDIENAKNLRDGLVAMIVIVALMLSGLLLLLLVSRKKASLLLEEQLVINKVLENTNIHLTETKCVLEAEKQQREALLGRQCDLIACFDQQCVKDLSKVLEQPQSSTSGSMTDLQHAYLSRIAAVRRAFDEDHGLTLHPNDNIKTFELLGKGSFGKVYRGLWRQTVVAIKVLLLPANMSGAEKREKMVVWEAAISSSLSHPNVVQTYTYSIKPVRESDKLTDLSADLQSLGSAVQICGDASNHGQVSVEIGSRSDQSSEGVIHSFEVQLVLEYCDKGSLRDALDQCAFLGPDGLNYAAILDSAMDVARAMLHLHCNNVLHMDLKAKNVMLTSSGMEGRGVCCKVSDFGLAVRIGHMETHVSGCFQGTMSHMAPEVLLEGRVSKAADVYSFGITLWELFTSGKPYKGVPKALLGHRVVKEQHRPALPLVMPNEYRQLIKKCWSPKAEHRPSFSEICDTLRELRSREPFPTPPIAPLQANSSKQALKKHASQEPMLASVHALGLLAPIGEESMSSLKKDHGVELVLLKGLRDGGSGLVQLKGSGDGGCGEDAGATAAPPVAGRISPATGAAKGAIGAQISAAVPAGPRGGAAAETPAGRCRVSFVGEGQLQEQQQQQQQQQQQAHRDGASTHSVPLSGPQCARHQRNSTRSEMLNGSYEGRLCNNAAGRHSPDTCQSDPGLDRCFEHRPRMPSQMSFGRSHSHSSLRTSSKKCLRTSPSSRSGRSSHSCVLIIGDQLDEEHILYPENNRVLDGVPNFSNRMELSNMSSTATLGFMLEPIGEERFEGPQSLESKLTLAAPDRFSNGGSRQF